jgi:uncharacterized protein YtpQ (UPF0354 family)
MNYYILTTLPERGTNPYYSKMKGCSPISGLFFAYKKGSLEAAFFLMPNKLIQHFILHFLQIITIIVIL